MLWIGTRSRGVARFDGQSWQSFTTDDGLADNGALSIAQDATGALWFAGGGVSRFRDDAWAAWTQENGLPGRVVSSIVPDLDDRLLFSGNGGVFVFEDEGWRTLFSTADGLPHQVTHAVLQSRRGDYWFATRKGAARFDGIRWTTYLAGRNVRAVLEDSLGNVWFGTARRGAIRFDGTQWTTYRQRRHMSPEIVDDTGAVWFSSDRGGAFRFDSENWRQFTAKDGLTANIVFDVFQDRQGDFWFATAGGLTRWSPASAE